MIESNQYVIKVGNWYLKSYDFTPEEMSAKAELSQNIYGAIGREETLVDISERLGRQLFKINLEPIPIRDNDTTD